MMRYCGNCFQEYDDSAGACPHCGYQDRQDTKGTNCLEQGTILNDRYIIGRVLGAGGFGITYLAYDKLLTQVVAIKEYLPGEFSTRIQSQALVTVYTGENEKRFHEGRQKFQDEARRLAQFQNHKGIVQIYDCLELNNTSYIVMEYLRGRTLQSILKEKGKFEVEEATRIIIQVLEALEDVHKIGILHRDIAPDNIILTEDNQVKLVDFGAARYAATTNSKSLSVVIKQGYAPVEQYQSKGDQGPWTDVYGAAATLYKMITGITPEDSMERYAKDELVRPSKLGIKIDKNTENALMNGLNIQIDGRYKSAAEFAGALSSNSVRLQTTKVKGVDVGKIPTAAKVGIGLAVAAVASVLVLFFMGFFDKDVQQWGFHKLAAGEYRVPNIINMGLVEAQASVEESHLTFMIVDKEYSDAIPKNKVLEQSLKAGSVAKEGDQIEVTVSGGAKDENLADNLADDEAVVPDVQYKTEAEAIKALESSGFEVEISYETNNTVEVGKVIRQDIEEGQVVKKGSAISIVVSGQKSEASAKSDGAKGSDTAQQQTEQTQSSQQTVAQNTNNNNDQQTQKWTETAASKALKNTKEESLNEKKEKEKEKREEKKKKAEEEKKKEEAKKASAAKKAAATTQEVEQQTGIAGAVDQSPDAAIQVQPNAPEVQPGGDWQGGFEFYME